IAASLTAARLGHPVTLVEYHRHVGGMSASGLGKSDIEHRAMIGGIFNEFVARVYDHYMTTYGADHENVALCQDGYYYEPRVAEQILESMLAEQPNITVLKGWRLDSVDVESDKVTAVTFVNRESGENRRLAGRVFIDATYEGDLYAAAGAEFR